MVGKADMGLYGWKQLVLWSLEHSCLDEEEYIRISTQWQQDWDKFVAWIISKYGDESEGSRL